MKTPLLTASLLLIPATALAEKNKPDVEEVIVTARRTSDFTEITQQADKLVNMPGALGDPLLAVMSVPGVIATGGDGGVPAVRGSGPADNVYLVDGIPAGYIFHAFSTSIFNERILQNFELYSAGFGPQYSNVTGGVFDIRLRQPRHEPLRTSVDLSMLRAGVMVEGALTENAEFYISGRQSLVQYFLNEEQVEKEDGIRVETPPQDNDYQLKYNWRPNSQQTLTFSANGATDLAEAAFSNISDEVRESPDFIGNARLKRGFNNQSLHWQINLPDAGQFNGYLGHFTQIDDTSWGNNQYFFKQNWRDNLIKMTYEQAVWQHHNISLGIEHDEHRLAYNIREVLFLCTSQDPDCEQRRGDIIMDNAAVDILMDTLFINDHWQIAEQWQWDIGMQIHHNSYSDESFTLPRTALAWTFADGWTASAAWGRYSRMQDLEFILPKMGNPDLVSQQSEHTTLGFKQELADGWSWSVNGYKKSMDDLPLARAPNMPETDPLYTNQLEGEAYGADILINKSRTDKWFGWFSLGYAKSQRTDLTTQQTSDYYLDTPLTANLVWNYQLTPKWNGGLRWSIHTGQATTPIIGVQQNRYFPDKFSPVYGEPYSKNLPVYSRLDLRFKKDTTLFGYPSAYTFDILNVLNRNNITGEHLDYDKVTSTDTLAIEQEAGLGIVPAAGISMTF